MDEFRTERLFWRAPGPEDIDAYQALVSDYEVVRWTASWPFPADREFTASRCKPFDPEKGFIGLVYEGDRLIGSAGVTNQVLGYMYSRDAWGKGYATEMGRALLARAFRDYDWPEVQAGVWHGNPGSVGVLRKLGFVRTGASDGFCRAQGRDLTGDDFTLHREEWARANPICLSTERLTLRSLTMDDWAEVQRIGGQPEVARMMLYLTVPWPEEAVRGWLGKSLWRGKRGYRLAISLRDGPMIGVAAISGQAVPTLGYFLDPDHWGKGYATEALRAVVRDCFDRFPVDTMEASHFVDNPASGRIIRKLGFELYGEEMGESAGRLEPAPELLYRLTRQQFEAVR